jgi:hypothetical protein
MWRKANVVFGLLLLATLIVVRMHLDDKRRFLELLQHLNPAWFLVAAGCQVGTYVCAAAVWHNVLHRSGGAIRLRALVPLGLAKLFVDQIAVIAVGVPLTILWLNRRGCRIIPQLHDECTPRDPRRDPGRSRPVRG